MKVPIVIATLGITPRTTLKRGRKVKEEKESEKEAKKEDLGQR